MSVSRNTAINLLAAVVPFGVSLLTVPPYLHIIGEDRYGVLAILWLLLGYFSIFDLGISRATTNHIARLRGAPRADREQVFWTATAINGTFGLVGGAVMYLFGAALVRYAFKMPEAMRSEVLIAMPWLAISVPLATVSGVFAGVLEGSERFGTVNTIAVIGSALSRVAPLCVAYVHGPELRWLIIAALIAQAASAFPLFMAAARSVPLSGMAWPTRRWVKPLFEYGGWVSINSILDPLFSSADRFLIGAGAGTAAVTVYTVPYNLVHRVQILPSALARTLFPRLSGLVKVQANELAVRGVRTLAAGMTPLMVAAIVFMHPFLSLWISPGFASRASGVGEVLAIGVWMSGLAFIPYASLQASGRPRTVAFVHLAEAPAFVAAIWLGVRVGGVVGAAWVMCARDCVDALIFMALGGLLHNVLGRLSNAGSWLVAALLLTRLCNSAPLISLIGGAILITSCALWAGRCEPFLRETAFRSLAKARSVLRAGSDGILFRGVR